MEFTNKIELRLTVDEIIDILDEHIRDISVDHFNLPNDLKWEIEFYIDEHNKTDDPAELAEAVASTVHTEK